jgi:hypothetical protein
MERGEVAIAVMRIARKPDKQLRSADLESGFRSPCIISSSSDRVNAFGWGEEVDDPPNHPGSPQGLDLYRGWLLR